MGIAIPVSLDPPLQAVHEENKNAFSLMGLRHRVKMKIFQILYIHALIHQMNHKKEAKSEFSYAQSYMYIK